MPRSSYKNSISFPAKRTIACQPRENGNMPAGQVPLQITTLVIMRANWENMPGMMAILEPRPIRLGRKSRMSGGCTIWLVTYGNGQIAGMIVVIRTVFYVAGAGTTSPGAVGRIVGAAAPPVAGSTLLASAWSSSHSQLAAHSGFAFEREGGANIEVSGSKGRSAARLNVSVATDNRNDHRRWAAV